MNKKNSKTTKTTTEAAAANVATTVPVFSVQAATAAAIAMAVVFTPPPVWKAESGQVPYWQIEIRDSKGNRYSNVYRATAEDRAKALAKKIALDRNLPIVAKDPYNGPAPKREDTEAVTPLADKIDPLDDVANTAAA